MIGSGSQRGFEVRIRIVVAVLGLPYTPQPTPHTLDLLDLRSELKEN